MLVEKTREEAMKAFLKGKQVRMLVEYDDGSMTVEPMEEMLPEEGIHYLVNVPAVENPEFAEAVADMVQEPREEETVTPPLKGAGGRGYASGRRDQERDRHKACRTGEDDKPDSEGDRGAL